MLLISDKLYVLLKIVREKLVDKKYFANFADQIKNLMILDYVLDTRISIKA